jgi:hypothetical protein
MEADAYPIVGVNIDLSFVVGHDPFTERQADAGAFELFAGIQPLEDEKNPLRKNGVDADALIGEDDLAIRAVLIELGVCF